MFPFKQLRSNQKDPLDPTLIQQLLEYIFKYKQMSLTLTPEKNDMNQNHINNGKKEWEYYGNIINILNKV